MAVPAIVKAFDAPKSNIVAFNPVIRGDNMKVTIANFGKLPGVVLGGHIELGDIRRSGELWAITSPAGDVPSIFVPPGATQASAKVNYSFSAEASANIYDNLRRLYLFKLANKQARSIFTVAVFTQDAAGNEKTLRIPVTMQYILSGLRSHYKKCSSGAGDVACYSDGAAQLSQVNKLLLPYPVNPSDSIVGLREMEGK